MLITAERVFDATGGKRHPDWCIFRDCNALYADQVLAGPAVVVLGRAAPGLNKHLPRKVSFQGIPARHISYAGQLSIGGISIP
ncbi:MULTISPECIES: hypothetical protein [unclassified Pseudomonas]|uniref:hypothetical protein n=1 Tax=unclassified Pseudomonas TaxID=196821 RepID=UPI000F73DFFC|nr:MULTISPECIES: hypothetical protein [unclassified Pseudomonas]